MTSQLLDFTDFIVEHTDGFVGRAWVFAAFDVWMADPLAPRFFVITGTPGSGKTAVAAQVTKHYQITAHHFCIAREAATIDPIAFTRSLSWQLCATVPGFAGQIMRNSGVSISIESTVNMVTNSSSVIGVQIKNLVPGGQSAVTEFAQTVVEPLRALYADGFAGHVLIVVDALDEAAFYRGRAR